MEPHGSLAILRHGRAINYGSIDGAIEASDVVSDRMRRNPPIMQSSERNNQINSGKVKSRNDELNKDLDDGLYSYIAESVANVPNSRDLE